MSGGGGSGKNDAQMPAEARKMWSIGQPIAERISTAAMTGMPLWDVPTMPNVPAPVMPTQGWFQSISPEVRAGLWEPYQEAGKALGEQMLSGGAGGSARAGYSGAYGAAMGELAGQAAKDVGLQAWQMTAPQLMDYRNQLYETQLQTRADILAARQAPFTLFPGYLGGVSQLPYYQQAQRPSPWMGAASGAATGAMIGGSTGNPYGAAAGAAIGGIYGYYSTR